MRILTNNLISNKKPDNGKISGDIVNGVNYYNKIAADRLVDQKEYRSAWGLYSRSLINEYSIMNFHSSLFSGSDYKQY